MKVRQVCSVIGWPVLLLLLTFQTTAQDKGLPSVPTKPKPTPTPVIKPAPTPTKPATKPTTKPTTKPPAPTPNPTPAPTLVCRAAPADIVEINFNNEISGKLDPRTAGCIAGSIGNFFFDEYKLNARVADGFVIQLSADFQVQLFPAGNRDNGLPIDGVPQGEQIIEYSLRTAALPADGEYRIKVSRKIDSLKDAPLPYKLLLKRTRMTDEGYRAEIARIEETLKTSCNQDAAQQVVSTLEQLRKEREELPAAYARLGEVYLACLKDVNKATEAFGQALQRRGTVRFKVTHGFGGREPEKDKKTKEYVFKDARTGWLEIMPGHVSIKEVASSATESFNATTSNLASVVLVEAGIRFEKTNPAGKKERFYLSPESRNQEEARLLIRLIEFYVRNNKS